MLTELSIENFAIIDRLTLNLSPGLTVLTGETGGGKSIIIDAVQAALGERVGADVVRSGSERAIVEAIFDTSEVSQELGGALRELEVENEGVLIFRREIAPGGRGSARLNGRAVPISTIARIGALLADIHGQSEHLSILRHERQLDVLDRYAGLQAKRAEMEDAALELMRLRKELAELKAGQEQAEQRLDLLRFQVQEIEGASIEPGEEDDLLRERSRLANAARLTELSEAARASLVGETGAREGLGVALSALKELAAADDTLASVVERLQSAAYEIDDLAGELRSFAATVELNPRRLSEVEERLALLTRLKRKYGASLDEVIAFAASARADLAEVETLDERIEELSAEAVRAEGRASELAEDLSEKRHAAARDLSAAMRTALEDLGLGGAAFEPSLSRTPDSHGLSFTSGERYAFSSTGVDAISFLVSFNPGEPLRPLEKVASGGETARFLLAVKSVLAGADEIPTLIFDEVDVGVGARHGRVVGERLRRLAGSRQVLSITHLPQIAALADQHISISKAVVAGRATVAAQVLESADRVSEIAQMMSGTRSATSLRSAEELLKAAQSSD